MDEILWAFLKAIGEVACEFLITAPGHLVRRFILRWDDSPASSLVDFALGAILWAMVIGSFVLFSTWKW